MTARTDDLRVVDTDDAVLSVIETINSYEKEIKNNVSTNGNICGVFFHDLVIYFSCILIQRETENFGALVPNFPYVSPEFARSPSLDLIRQSGPRDLENSLRIRIRQTAFLPFAVGNAIPFGYNQAYWQSKFVNLLGEYQKPTKVYLENLELQFDALSECIKTISQSHNIENLDVMRGLWLKHVSNHSTDTLTKTKCNFLVVGNRQDLQNRKLAYNYLELNKEVIAFTHGEIASTIFEEPMYCYAERGLCTTLVEYGAKAASADKEGVLSPPVNVLYRDSKVALSKYRKSDNITSKKFEDAKLLYIPTTYVGNEIYGPYHAYPDPVYREWHHAIHRVIPNIIFKSHPKSKGNFELPGSVERRWLDDCIEEYDVFILDYVATSTVLAMLMDKPVIFLDIGLRRLAPKFLSMLKERCHYVSIDINGDLDDQITEAISSYSAEHSSWSNLGLENYCLSGHSTFRWKDIFRRAM